MKILHLSNDYYFSSIYKNLHQHLLSYKIDSLMTVPSYNNDKERPKEEKVNHLKCFNKSDRFFYLYKQKKILESVKREVQLFLPDVLHAHFLFSNGYTCMKIKEEYDIPYIVAIRNTDVNVFFEKVVHLRRIGIKIMLNAENIIFISPSYRDQVIATYVPQKYKESFLKKSIVIPNGIDIFWHNNTLRLERRVKDKRINLITVGTVNKNKNQLTVAKALNLLVNEGYQITYSVLGEIEDKKVFNELIKYPFVKYIERQPKEKLILYYRESDIFIMPSVTETFGLVYAEAMSQGLPIIYTEGQGFDGQFTDGEIGFKVGCFNIDYIARKIIDIMDNFEVISNRCVVHSQKFNWDAVTKEYMNIYNEIMSRKCNL
ncbi:glycosyltransferase family 4 protein [Cytobacillus suaedae]|nr:glycosyltransferase family 4 protein [Cytobacillus suaedae]